VLEQSDLDAESSEITAVPKLRGGRSLQGTIVTAEAFNGQRASARQIVDQGGDDTPARCNQGIRHDCR